MDSGGQFTIATYKKEDKIFVIGYRYSIGELKESERKGRDYADTLKIVKARKNSRKRTTQEDISDC